MSKFEPGDEVMWDERATAVVVKVEGNRLYCKNWSDNKTLDWDFDINFRKLTKLEKALK